MFARPEHNRFGLAIGLILRYRAELTVITLGIFVFSVVAHHLPAGLPAGLAPGQGTGIIMATTLVVVVAIPVSRRYVFARCWAVMTRHRLRACFYQTRTWTTNGRMPFLLWSRPSPVGERVRVWLPAGLSVNHLERIDDELAAACWAREVRITPIRKQAAMAIVEIIRHDPLDTLRPLTPPVVDHLDRVDPLAPPAWLPTAQDIDNAVPAPTNGTNGTKLTVVKPTGTKPTGTKRPASAATAVQADPPAVTGFGGEDVSDYI